MTDKPAVAPRETQTEPRDLAVEIVDGIHGYTWEYAPDSAYHLRLYDMVETKIRAHLEGGR